MENFLGLDLLAENLTRQGCHDEAELCGKLYDVLCGTQGFQLATKLKGQTGSLARVKRFCARYTRCIVTMADEWE